MGEEITALIKNETWKLATCSTGVQPVTCKWVYKVKRWPKRSVNQYKAHLVACGFSQIYMIVFYETYSLVAKIIIGCVLIAFTISKN